MGIFDSIKCALIELCNLLIEHVLNNLLSAIAWVIGLLPSFPIENEPLQWGEFGKSLGYFFPLGTMAQHFVLMLTVIAIWYAYEYIMRWIKMIK
ncbi:hypothetical protein LSPCS325_53740 [Lysinibacillus sp. CTST325]